MDIKDALEEAYKKGYKDGAKMSIKKLIEKAKIISDEDNKLIYQIKENDVDSLLIEMKVN